MRNRECRASRRSRHKSNIAANKWFYELIGVILVMPLQIMCLPVKLSHYPFTHSLLIFLGNYLPNNNYENRKTGWVRFLHLPPMAYSVSSERHQLFRSGAPKSNHWATRSHNIYVRTYVGTHACACMRTCMHACMYICMHACMYVCMYVCILYSINALTSCSTSLILGTSTTICKTSKCGRGQPITLPL